MVDTLHQARRRSAGIMKSVSTANSLASFHKNLQGYLDNGYSIMFQYVSKKEQFFKIRNPKGNVITFYFDMQENVGTIKHIE